MEILGILSLHVQKHSQLLCWKKWLPESMIDRAKLYITTVSEMNSKIFGFSAFPTRLWASKGHGRVLFLSTLPGASPGSGPQWGLNQCMIQWTRCFLCCRKLLVPPVAILSAKGYFKIVSGEGTVTLLQTSETKGELNGLGGLENIPKWGRWEGEAPLL